MLEILADRLRGSLKPFEWPGILVNNNGFSGRGRVARCPTAGAHKIAKTGPVWPFTCLIHVKFNLVYALYRLNFWIISMLFSNWPPLKLREIQGAQGSIIVLANNNVGLPRIVASNLIGSQNVRKVTSFNDHGL